MKLITKDKSFYQMLIALAIPVALQNLITFAVNFADNLMVGALGDTAVSGVYMANQLQTFLQFFTAGIEGALIILATQYWGKKDTQSIKKIISVGTHFALLSGVIITLVCFFTPQWVISIFTNDMGVVASGAVYLKIVCFSYIFFCITQVLIASMRSVECAKIGMTVSCISLFANIGLNYVLIFGKPVFPALGVAGAAVATLISRIIEASVMIVYVLKIDTRLQLTIRSFSKSDKLIRRDFIKYGVPIILGNIVWSINLMANSAILGRFGEEVITATSVANTMNSLAYVTMNGMAAAVGIITGKTIGEGKYDLMKEYAYTVQILFLTLGLITGGVIAAVKLPFIGLYSGISREATAFSNQFISVLSVTIIGTCYQAACLMGLVKSGGDIGFVFKMDTIFVFLIVLPSAIISAYLGAPPWVVFACLKCDQILKCLVAVIKINKFNWMKNLAR